MHEPFPGMAGYESYATNTPKSYCGPTASIFSELFQSNIPTCIRLTILLYHRELTSSTHSVNSSSFVKGSFAPTSAVPNVDVSGNRPDGALPSPSFLKTEGNSPPRPQFI